MIPNPVDIPGHLEAAGNLPAEPNAFIGRERDLADLVSMLGRVRMLTLCGPGGIGKARFALKLAANLAKDEADGAWMADLADAEAPDRLLALVAYPLGAEPEDRQHTRHPLLSAPQSRAIPAPAL